MKNNRKVQHVYIVLDFNDERPVAGVYHNEDHATEKYLKLVDKKINKDDKVHNIGIIKKAVQATQHVTKNRIKLIG